MHKFSIFLSLLSWFSAYGQNLVNNPSFEEVIKQPCNFVSFGSSINDYFTNWTAPTGGTSDAWFYDSTQANQCGQNLFRHQQKPQDGTYCAGISISNAGTINTRKPYREYIQVPLIKALEVGKIYYAEFYVLLQQQAELAANNVGMYFSKDKITINETLNDFGSLLNVTPQINSTHLIREQTNWVKISGCFRAEEPHSFLTIGNFFSDEQTQLVNITNEAVRLGSYFLIDNITVREAETNLLLKPNFLGSDTTLCFRQTLTVQLPQTNEIIYSGWPLSKPYEFTFTETGIYSITATSGLCAVVDTLQLRIETPIKLPADTTICFGETLKILPNNNTSPLLWSDGSSSPYLDVNQSGIYWVKVLSNYCANSDSIKVNFVNCPGVIPNVFTPNGDNKNDYFYIKNIELLPWQLIVYNRYGKLVYESYAYKNDWNGPGLPAGTYYYTLSNTELKRTLKGWVEIIR